MKRCLPLILTLSLLLSGCSGSIFTNYREIEQMQLIQTLGVDRMGNRLSVSVSGGHSSETTKLSRMTAAGPSILTAMELLQDYTASEQLYYAHTRYVLLGETVVQDALPELIDYMARSTQLRSDIPVLIVRNGTAGDLVLRCGQEDTDITDALKSIIRDSQRRGDCTIFTLQSLISDLAESKAALLAAVEPRPLTDTEPQAELEEITPILTGYAILKDAKLAGYLDLEDARGVNYLRNKTGTESITLPQVGQAGQVTLTLTRSRAKTEPVFAADGRITGIHVTVRAAAFVEEMEHPEELDRAVLTKAFSDQLARWITATLRAMTDTGADFLGLGLKFSMAHPFRWAKLPVSWADSIPDLTVTVDTDCRITHTDELH